MCIPGDSYTLFFHLLVGYTLVQQRKPIPILNCPDFLYIPEYVMTAIVYFDVVADNSKVIQIAINFSWYYTIKSHHESITLYHMCALLVSWYDLLFRLGHVNSTFYTPVFRLYK